VIIMTGVAEFQRALDDIVARTNAATRQAVTTGGHVLEAETKRLLSNSGTAGAQGRDENGRFVKVARPSSPPGSPPMLQTGTLRRSIKVVGPDSTGPTGWTISVGPTVIYGRIHELGGDTGRGGSTHLPARPFLKPALDNVIANGTLADCYATAWRTAF